MSISTRSQHSSTKVVGGESHGKRQFKFTFVLAVYNVEEYLDETLRSIIGQTIGFEDVSEVILVNDGSTDGSGEICRRYQQKYPDNVVYVEQKNQGVGAARNAGIRRANGKYLSFLDPDDKISADTLEKVYAFFEEHYDQIDLASIKLVFFEGRTGDHALNYKYRSSRVIDVEKEYDAPQLSAASSFIKREVFDKGYVFDTNLKYTEDAKLLNEIILDKMRYGVVSGPTYHYRRRLTALSAINHSRQDPDWYTEHLDRAYGDMMRMSQKKLGFVCHYTQYLVIYDAGGRLAQDFKTIPKGVNKAEYKRELLSLLGSLDDEVILSEKKLARMYKLMIIEKKYGINILIDTKIIDGKVFYKDLQLYNIPKKTRIVLDILKEEDDRLHIEGYLAGYRFKGMMLEVSDGQSSTEARYLIPYAHKPASYSLGEKIHESVGFSVLVPLHDGAEITMHAVIDGQKYALFMDSDKIFSPAGHPEGYVVQQDFIVLDVGNGNLRTMRNTFLNRVKCELRYQRDLYRRKEYGQMWSRLALFGMK